MGLRTTGIADKGPGVRSEGIEQTLLFWQPRATNTLTAEDARQMIESITGFFTQLEAWDTRELSAVIGILEGQEENVAA